MDSLTDSGLDERVALANSVYRKEVASTCLGVLSTLELPCEKSNYPPGETTWSDLTLHGKGERPSHPCASAELTLVKPSSDAARADC